MTQHPSTLLKSLLTPFLLFFQVHRAIGKVNIPAKKACLYVDACEFDPHRASKYDRSVIIIAHNNANTISACVREHLSRACAVVVVDRGSADATPHLAAEAGAVVLLLQQKISVQDGLCHAFEMAHRFSNNILVIDME
jgi:hypothetical protein